MVRAAFFRPRRRAVFAAAKSQSSPTFRPGSWMFRPSMKAKLVSLGGLVLDLTVFEQLESNEDVYTVAISDGASRCGRHPPLLMFNLYFVFGGVALARALALAML